MKPFINIFDRAVSGLLGEWRRRGDSASGLRTRTCMSSAESARCSHGGAPLAVTRPRSVTANGGEFATAVGTRTPSLGSVANRKRTRGAGRRSLC